MKKQFIYICLLWFPLFGEAFAQVQLDSIVVTPPRKKRKQIPSDLDDSKRPRLLASNFVNFDRDPYLEPLPPISLAETLSNMQKDSLIHAFYRHILAQDFVLNLEDTLSIAEQDIGYIGGRNYVAIHKQSKDTLNGLYKVKARRENQAAYDYYLGYFLEGAFYLEGVHNVFEYYKSGKMVKRQYISGSFSYFGVLAEAYTPLGQKRWKRKLGGITGMPYYGPEVKDTIVYTGKFQEIQKFVIYHKSYYPKGSKLRIPQKGEDTDVADDMPKPKYMNVTEGFHIIFYTPHPKYELESTSIGWSRGKVSTDNDTQMLEKTIYHYGSKPMRRSVREYQEWVTRLKNIISKNKDSRWYCTDFQIDTLRYIAPIAYIEGRQYAGSYHNHNAYTKQYKNGKLQSVEIYLDNQHTFFKNYIDFTSTYVGDAPELDHEAVAQINIHQGKVIKDIEIKAYRSSDKRMIQYAKFKNIRNPLKKQYYKKQRIHRNFVSLDYANIEYIEDKIRYYTYNLQNNQDLCMIAVDTQASFGEGSWHEYQDTIQYKRGRIHRTINTGMLYLDDSLTLHGKTPEIYDVEIHDYQKGIFITEIWSKTNNQLIFRSTERPNKKSILHHLGWSEYRDCWYYQRKNKKVNPKKKKATQKAFIRITDEYFDIHTGKLISKKRYKKNIK